MRTWLFEAILTEAGHKHGHQITGWYDCIRARKRRIAKKHSRIMFGKRIKPAHYKLKIMSEDPHGRTK